ncbi:PepSY domain-containing protein [Xanthobacter sp. AM11]|uniref:PepSY domain-containing protein n=1 Tax=Xanthobacter sp. AM11 TaxID=3380643 RepID=UPI0039BEE138
MKRQLLAAGFVVFCAIPAFADRPVTDEEQAKLTALLAAQGCQGGRYYVDDGIFEIDNATCADNHKYDFKYSPDYKMLDKDFER